MKEQRLQVVKQQSHLDTNKETICQYSTFSLAGNLFGIDVMKVQEVVKPMQMTKVPLAPPFVRGLINLRGQIATAIDMRALLGLEENSEKDKQMNVICVADGALLSLLVDEIGDVLDVSNRSFEETPDTVPQSVRRFMTGLHKIPGNLLSVIDTKKVFSHLNET